VRPTFLVIGAMKAGTTGLWEYLHDHPSVYLAPKEPDFFSFRFERGLAWYDALFAAAGDAPVRGDVSPSYTACTTNVMERIGETLPGVRLVYSLRDPVERTKAHYLHAVAGGRERRPIETALAETPWYVTCSRYVRWIEAYLEHVDRSQLLLITAEDLRGRREETLDRVLRFIGLDPGWRPPTLTEDIHRTSDKRVARVGGRRLRRFAAALPVGSGTAERLLTKPIDPEIARLSPDTEQRLRDSLRDDVAALRAYMPPDFDGWGIA
jgi:hypothetical protein